MMIRTLSLLALLGGAVAAQDTPPALSKQQPAPEQSTEAENLFYKAFFLDRHRQNRAAAVALYTQFLEKAPSHSYAKIAAQNAFILLNRDGKAQEASAFQQKYATLINADADRNEAAEARPEAGERQGRGQRGERGEGMRGRPNVDELRAELARAKEAGDEAKVKELEQQIQRIEQFRQRGQGQGGQGQGGQRGRGGAFALLGRPVTELNDEEVGQLTQSLDRMSGFLDRMRDNGQSDQADKLEKSIAAFKKALSEGKKDEAEKLRTEITSNMPRMGGQGRRGGGGEGAGGPRRGGNGGGNGGGGGERRGGGGGR